MELRACRGGITSERLEHDKELAEAATKLALEKLFATEIVTYVRWDYISCESGRISTNKQNESEDGSGLTYDHCLSNHVHTLRVEAPTCMCLESVWF